MASVGVGFGALGFGVHALVHREKAKTQFEMRHHVDQNFDDVS